MFVSKRKIKGKVYFYLEDRLNGKRISFFLGGKKQANARIEAGFNELLREKAVHNAKNSLKKFKPRVLSFPEILLLERLKLDFELLQDFFPQAFKSFEEDEFVRYAQGSASVEGNSLSLQEASIVLSKGVSIAGKKIDEIKEIENMKKAALVSKRVGNVTERSIKKIHSAIMDGFEEKKPGEYRQEPMFITASRVKTTKAEQVPKETEKLLEWYKKNLERVYPIELASEFHTRFEQIHPFLDGNGRTGRELLNLMLQRQGFPRAIINLKNGASYIVLLERVQLSKQHPKFSKFIFACLESRAKEVGEIIKENKGIILKKLLEKKK